MEGDDPGEALATVGAASTKSPLSLGSPDTEASVLTPWGLVRSIDKKGSVVAKEWESYWEIRTPSNSEPYSLCPQWKNV